MFSKRLLGLLLLSFVLHARGQEEPVTTPTTSSPLATTPTSGATTPTSQATSLPSSSASTTSPSSSSAATTSPSSSSAATTSPSSSSAATTSPVASSATTATSSESETSATTSSPTTSTPSSKICDKVGLTCLDCKTLQFCDNVGDPQALFNITCSDQTAKVSPYCDESTEECTKENTCTISNNPEELVECEQAGIRPDPNDCTQYIQCVEGTSASGFVGYAVNCPAGLRYMQTSGKCVSTLSCPTMATYCAGKSGKMVSYKPYPSIYAFCPASAAGEPIIRMCKGQYQFVESIGNCQPVCTKAGTIPSNEDCHKYYSCDKTGFGYSMILNSCPTGYGFNQETQLCDASKANCVSVGRTARRRRDADYFNSFFLRNLK